ncbi:NAD-dependent 4,6-dehydratase LegB [Pelagibius sp.]|uniref:NAD-dependent 4,6-dehydratase LegB n=1 Tax=Pelagibius sp. TaxID=1931238 RepID=UPI003B50B70A
MTGYKTAFVSGADGFIGSHLTEELVKQGHRVRALVFYNSFDRRGWLDCVEDSILDSIDIVSGDIRDPFFMRSAVQGCDVVFHLAALVGIPYSYIAPESYLATNVQGTLNLLQAARAADVRHFIHTSTSEVYGTAQFVPISENHPLQPQSPYSATKIAADSLALSFHSSFGLPVTVVRPFNTYGPRQSARAVIPTIITQLADGTGPVRLGSVHPTRDFNFVDDTVNGFVAVMDCSAAFGEVINLGSSFEISIKDTAVLVAEVMKTPIEIVEDHTRKRPGASEVERLWADTSRAEELLSWRPRYGGLEGFRSGIQATVKWFADPANRVLARSHRYTI